MKTIAFVQARMGSSRLPGKVLRPLGEASMLELVVSRARRAKSLDEVVVVTSDLPQDDAIASLCESRKIRVFRGSHDDVLDRFYQAAQREKPDVIVRITADCPFTDPAIVDQVVAALAKSGADYASNVVNSTFPEGLDVEAFTRASLDRAWSEAKLSLEREHVTPYIRHSGLFTSVNVANTVDASGERWTVDDERDYLFVEAILRALPRPFTADMAAILSILRDNPDLRAMQPNTVPNQGYHKSLYADASAAPVKPRDFRRSEALYARACAVIPGASQTFSKAQNQYVRGTAPMFLERGLGAHVWDVDGNEYIDYVQALLPNILGYAHPEVNAVAAAQMGKGNSFSLPHPIEVELAEKLTTIIPCAEMVRFAKNGSDVTAGAIRVARAFTGRERVACSGYHGWQDWFIGSTTRNAGVPVAVRNLTHPFPYNDLAKLDDVLSAHPGEFAAVIMEPVNFTPPTAGYLEGVKELAHKHGAIFIFDEICSGFHFGLGGAQKRFGVTPDLACFGKAMGNGFPIAALVGRRDIMTKCEEIFFSSTFGGEAMSLAAAMKVLEILETTDALPNMERRGKRLMEGFNSLANIAGLSNRFACIGYPTWSLLKYRDENGVDSFLMRSLFQQEVAKRGILQLVTHNMTAAHDDRVIESTLRIYADVFKVLSGWLSEKDPSSFLEGPVIQPVFRVR